MKLEDEIDEAKEKVNNINADKLRGITHKDPELEEIERELK
jgi:hypothetical protein